MRAGATSEPRVRGVHRVGVGILEVIPEDAEARSLWTLKENLRNRLCALLVAVIVAAQLADVVTTFRALSGQAYVENNPLLRALIVRSPLAAYTVKLLLVSAVLLLVLSRLRGRRAQAALVVAGGISLIAPVLNFLLITHG